MNQTTLHATRLANMAPATHSHGPGLQLGPCAASRIRDSLCLGRWLESYTALHTTHENAVRVIMPQTRQANQQGDWKHPYGRWVSGAYFQYNICEYIHI